MSLLYQFIGTAIICTMSVNLGLVFAWPAFTLSLFQSQNTTLNRPMTDTEISFFSSIGSIGALVITPTAGYMLEKLGRKKCAIVSSLVIVIFWTLLTLSRQVEVVLAAVFVSGISSTIIIIASVYISEICQDSIRGSTAAMSMVAYGIGMLMAYLIAGYLSYSGIIYFGLTSSVAGSCLLFLLKDSPMHLLRNDSEKEALKSLAFYRNLKLESKELTAEFNTMLRVINPDLENETAEEAEKLQPDSKPAVAKKLSLWQFIKKSESSRRAFFVNIVVMTAALLQGLVVVQIYVEILFREALPNVAPSLCSVLFAVVTVVSGVVAAIMTDRFGRRPLMIYASLGAGLCCFVLGTQLHLHWGPSWVTALFLYLFPAMYTLGAGTVPFVLMAELFLPEVKSFFSMVLLEYVWSCNFIILFIFKPVLTTVGWGVVFYIFAVMGLLSSAFSVFFLPETKGLNVEAIQALFISKQKTPKLY